MEISIIDASNYFKGLLLLIRKDRQVTPHEVELLKRIGKTLGFEREFCETAIHDILENNYIEDTPPVFSSKEIALKFIKDGLSIAFADEALHPLEETWLQSTAQENGLDAADFTREHHFAAAHRSSISRLEVDTLQVRHS